MPAERTPLIVTQRGWVQEYTWGPDDKYLAIGLENIPVHKPFKAGERVKITITIELDPPIEVRNV